MPLRRPPPPPSSSRHSVEDALRSNGRCLAPPFFLLLICHLALLPSDSLFSQTSLTPHCASLAYPLLRQALPALPPPPLQQKTEDVSFTTKVEMHPHHYPTISSPLSSVMVWTLMKKRWVFSRAPIYLSGQGTCTLMPTSPCISHCHIHSCHHRNLFQDRSE